MALRKVIIRHLIKRLLNECKQLKINRTSINNDEEFDKFTIMFYKSHNSQHKPESYL